MTTDPRTTGIGSLPHHNVDAALKFSFQMGIPFLPQIPLRNHWEYMIAQALEGLPGLQVGDAGEVAVHLDIWSNRAHEFSNRLKEAFAQGQEKSNAFEAFEPGAATSSSWQPFLWEIQERMSAGKLSTQSNIAKAQLAGPLTCQWVLRTQKGLSIENEEGLATQIFQLILARSIAMVRRFKQNGILPLFYIDEPGLYALSLTNPKHVLALQELRLMVQTLKKEGAVVGLHCCSNTNWEAILGLGIDYLSIDAALSLKSALEAKNGTALETFIQSGGKLSLGVIPTGRSSLLHSLNVPEIFAAVVGILSTQWSHKPELVKRVLGEAIYTPACGLALQSIADAELILDALQEYYRYSKEALGW